MSVESPRCVIDYSLEGFDPCQSPRDCLRFDFVVDSFNSIFTNFQALRNIQSRSVHPEDVHVCVLGVGADASLPSARVEVLVDFLSHLLHTLGIRSYVISVGEAIASMHSASISCEQVGDCLRNSMEHIRGLVAQKRVQLAHENPWAASLEVHYAEVCAAGLSVSGWVTNVGDSCWYAHAGEETVRLGFRCVDPGVATVAEPRFTLPLDTVPPGSGFAFEVELPVSVETFSRLEFGMVIESRCWFSDSGLRPTAVHVPAVVQSFVALPPSWSAHGMLCITYDEESDGGPCLEPDVEVCQITGLGIKRFRASSVTELCGIIERHQGWDVAILRAEASPCHDAWLGRLMHGAYSKASVAAAGGLLVDSQLQVIDLGGELYSSGYTHCPGFQKGLTAPEVITCQSPSFLSSGVFYLRGDALKLVGSFADDLGDLKVALIEWCYRARSLGFVTRIVHGCQVLVGAQDREQMIQPPIDSYRQRRRLLGRLSGLCVEALNG